MCCFFYTIYSNKLCYLFFAKLLHENKLLIGKKYQTAKNGMNPPTQKYPKIATIFWLHKIPSIFDRLL